MDQLIDLMGGDEDLEAPDLSAIAPVMADEEPVVPGEEGEVAPPSLAAPAGAPSTMSRRWVGSAIGWTRNKLMSSITTATRAFGGKEMEEALVQVQQLLGVFFDGADEAYSFDAFLSLVLLAIYYRAPKVTSGVLESSEDFTREGCHYFRFAAAAYGWKLLNGIMFDDKEGTPYIVKGFVTGDEQNNMAVCEHTGIARADILASKWTSSDFHPAHYIAVDHCTESVVLAIRGTFHIKDALTDMLGHSTPFHGGLAHSGMVTCATKKLASIKESLLASLSAHYGYRLVVVGHSLGAGSATLISLMLRQEYPEMDVRCFAYAPPCVLDLQSAYACKTFISSFILDTDVVPRLSYGSLDRLRQLTLKVMEQTESNSQRILQALAAGALTDGMSQRISSWLDHDMDVSELHGTVNTLDDKLFPAGNVFSLEHAKDEEDPRLYLMEVSNATFFADIIISKTMFSNHMPNAYNKAFAGVERYRFTRKHRLAAGLEELKTKPAPPPPVAGSAGVREDDFVHLEDTSEWKDPKTPAA